MNYIKQIKYFWQQFNKHNLGSNEVAMYYYLLEVCNSSDWRNPLQVRTSLIMQDLAIKSRTSFIKVRDNLQNAGLLNYKTARGTLAAEYTLTDVLKDKIQDDVQDEVQLEVQDEVQLKVQDEVQHDGHPILYNKTETKTEAKTKTINKNITVGNKQFKNTTASRWLQQHKQAYMDELLSTQLRTLTAQQIFDVMDAETNLYHFRDENHVCNYFKRTGERILQGAFKKPPNPRADTTYSTNTFEYVKPKNVITGHADPDEFYQRALQNLKQLNGD